MTGLLAALGAAALVGLGCTPDIPAQAPPAFIELQFDPSSTPPKSYEPTVLIIDPTTKLIDFSAAGIEVPPLGPDPGDPTKTRCETQTALALAQCEFYQYLEQLDGFPTLAPGKTFVSAPLDLSTVTMPGNLFIYEFLRGTAPTTAVDLSFDAAGGFLKLDPRDGWDVGGLYFVALRGYQSGVKGVDGTPAVSSIIYVLLKQDQSLSCDAATADEVSESCFFYGLFASDPRFSSLPPADQKAAIAATLVQLEQLRSVYKGLVPELLPFDVWAQIAERADMPPEEVGILWVFPTHTGSVVELNPNTGKAPVVNAAGTEIRLRAKGTIKADTVKPFGLAAADGTVFLLNATAFLANDLGNALPTFTAAYEAASGDIVLTAAAPLIDGNQYIVLLTNEIQNTHGAPLVPSPVSVLLRTRGELVDDYAGCAATPPTAKSLVSGVADADACQLEFGRTGFKALLDNSLVKSLTAVPATRPDGVTREIVAYLYGFEYTKQ